MRKMRVQLGQEGGEHGPRESKTINSYKKTRVGTIG